MQVVYFPEELHNRAPTVLGVLCAAPSNQWVSLYDVIDLVRTGETVAIRPASETELQRAESHVALYEIGVALGEQIGALLDHEPSDVVAQKITALQDAIRSVDMPAPGLIDEDPAGEQMAGEGPPVPVIDIPQLCASLAHAHAAGDLVTALDLAAHIPAVLLDSMPAQPGDEHDEPAAA